MSPSPSPSPPPPPSPSSSPSLSPSSLDHQTLSRRPANNGPDSRPIGPDPHRHAGTPPRRIHYSSPAGRHRFTGHGLPDPLPFERRTPPAIRRPPPHTAAAAAPAAAVAVHCRHPPRRRLSVLFHLACSVPQSARSRVVPPSALHSSRRHVRSTRAGRISGPQLPRLKKNQFCWGRGGR